MSISGTTLSKYFLLSDTVFRMDCAVSIGDTQIFHPFRISPTEADIVVHVDMAAVPNCTGYASIHRTGNTFTLHLNPQKISVPEDWHVFSLLPITQILLERGTLILHASGVICRDRAILFSGPSGIGKSTQAQLWQQYRSGTVINGDRCLIYQKDGVYYASSHLHCGSSGIAEGHRAPIGAIILLDQGLENIVTHPSPIAAFQKILHQCAYEPSDQLQLRQATDLVAKLVSGVTVLQYQCRKDESSVIELERIL